MAKKRKSKLTITLTLDGPATFCKFEVPYIEEGEYQRDAEKMFDLIRACSKNRAFLCHLCGTRKEAGEHCDCQEKASKE